MSYHKNIPVAGPWITQKEIDYVTDAVTNAWYENANMYHQKFEKAFADYLGVDFAISLPSCTSGLHISLASLGVGPGDEVIVPETTWIATAAPISYVGAKPVFADIDSKNWCLSPESFKECITEKTKVVIPVDLYGNVPEWDEILKIASDNNIAVIEDAAQSIGSQYKGKKTGTFGDTGVFSFHGSKTMTTGEGGMLVTNNQKLYERALILRDHGRSPGNTMFINEEVSYKYKMSSMQAALGLAQIERIEELIAKKREIFNWYKDDLQDVSELIMNSEESFTFNTYWMVTIILDPQLGLTKEALMHKLGEKGISTRPFFNPLSSLPAYKEISQENLKSKNRVAYKFSQVGVNLPSALSLTREEVRYVCHCLKKIIHDNGV